MPVEFADAAKARPLAETSGLKSEEFEERGYASTATGSESATKLGDSRGDRRRQVDAVDTPWQSPGTTW